MVSLIQLSTDTFINSSRAELKLTRRLAIPGWTTELLGGVRRGSEVPPPSDRPKVVPK